MIIVDASVAAKWIFPEEHTARARALLRHTLNRSEVIAAPPLLFFEVTNIVRKRIAREGVSRERGRRELERFLAIPVEQRSFPGIHQRALAIATEFNLPAAYDAHYVALAEYLACTLWTDDQRLIRDLGGAVPFLRAIADYPS